MEQILALQRPKIQLSKILRLRAEKKRDKLLKKISKDVNSQLDRVFRDMLIYGRGEIIIKWEDYEDRLKV